jgi:nudix-type nucleoside diphosphatase, YffH/AdpP family
MSKGPLKDLHLDILSDQWYTLRKATYQYQRRDGQWETQQREAYDRGNGAAILLYNKEKSTVILTRQFRLPTYLNGNNDGMMIEVCAGILDEDNPDDCIRREALEETGYQIKDIQKVMETYMSPGAVTEILYLYLGSYDSHMKISEGGGEVDEQEDIEVMELPFARAIDMMRSGEIRDAKTVMLLQYAQIHQVLSIEQ